MGEWLKGVLPASAGFCLYRSAATFLYNSGMGMYRSSVGFVSDLSFVLAMNACACAFAAVLLLLLRAGRLGSWCASPWAACVLVLAGVLAGWPGPLASPIAAAAGRFAAAAACGVALTMLSVVWIDFFVAQNDPARVFAQVVVGYTLYTAVTCLYAWMPNPVALAVSLGFLAVSAAMVRRLEQGTAGSLGREGRFPPPKSYPELSTYVAFFVLVGVVGIMHTSVIGSSAEYVIAVPMWVTRVLSLAAFLLVVVLMGQSVSLSAVFKWVFPILIAVLTLLPFAGARLGSLTGLVSIVGYNVCGMVFYLFIIREGRRLDLSAALLAGMYMLGSSGTLLVGLLIGLVLSAMSASLDLSLLTVVAFAAIYPLALVLILLVRRRVGVDAAVPGARGRGVGSRADLAGSPGPDGGSACMGRSSAMAEPRPLPVGPSILAARRADAVAERYGLTRREREVLHYLVAGRSVKYIAETLVISENTAWTHAKRIYAKTETHGKQELMDLVEKGCEGEDRRVG